LVSKGKAAAYKQRHARVLLKADEGPHGEQWTDAEISRALDVHSSTIERLRQRFVEESLEACLQRKEQKNRKAKKFDGAAEARLTAVACSDPPEGRECWTLKLLADEMVALEIVDSVCRETVRKTLKKNVLKPWMQEMWCIPAVSALTTSALWRTCSMCTISPTIPGTRWCVWTRPSSN
jgi:transposase